MKQYFIIHGYDRVSETVIWQTVDEDLSELESHIRLLIEQEGREN